MKPTDQCQVGYTYGHLIPTLAMIETAEKNTYVAVANLEEEDENSPPAYSSMPGAPKPNPVDPDVLLVKQAPVTSSLRGTVLHLRAKAGWTSRFRGFTIFLVWAMSRGFISGIITTVPGLRNIFGAMIAHVLAEVCLSTFHLTWIWIVISDPSPLPWYKRLPPFRRSFPRIAPAVAVQAVATQIATTLPVLLCGTWGPFRRFGDDYSVPVEKGELAHAFGQSILLIGTMLALFVLLSIPATVTLTRVAASMLPDSDETIVPFDRSFGGKVTPAILGGQGKIGMLEAWRSFGWYQRRNLLRVVTKAFLLIFALWILSGLIIMAEVHFIGGDSLRKAMKGRMGYQ
jgi:hypothetical protein